MSLEERLTLRDIAPVFKAAIDQVGGNVSSSYEDESCLFLRSILPWDCEVRPGDRLHAGAALRATGADVWVHPYVYRAVCTNGAIFVEAAQTRHLSKLDSEPREAALAALNAAIRTACAREAFADAAGAMRASRDGTASHVISTLALLDRFPGADRLRRDFLRYFARELDGSAYGFANAVTALARSTREPALRWRLEALGGSMFAAAATAAKQHVDTAGAAC